MFDWEKNKVCLAEGPKDAYVLLALRPAKLSDEGGDGETIIWDDGDHQRAFPVDRVLDDEPELFRFEDDRGRRFTLRSLTARLYAEKVQAQVAGPDLPTDEAVTEFYLAPREW